MRLFSLMKCITLIFTCFAVLAFSCTREKVRTVGWPYWGEAFALRNGEEWYPKVNAIKLPAAPPQWITINIDWFQPVSGYQRESLGFARVRPSRLLDTVVLIKAPLHDDHDSTFATYATRLDDGDVLGDWYDVLETEENYLIVTAWDAEEQEIEGKFQVSFLFRGGVHSTPDATDTVRFEDGYFHTKVVN